MLSLQHGITAGMLRRPRFMPTKTFTLDFPEEDAQFAISLESFSQAAQRLAISEERLLQDALGFYLESIKDENGLIPNHKAAKEHARSLGLPEKSPGMQSLFNKLGIGESTCSDIPNQEMSSAAGSPKTGT